MITWNRREYLEKSLPHLLSDSSAFRLYIWDNNSTDGARDIVDAAKDDRIVVKKFNNEDVGQFTPWHWYLENCRGDIAGKLDDDIRGEPGWPARFSEMITSQPSIGGLGAWIFLRNEWNPTAAAHKVVRVGEYEIFQNAWIGGCIFLCRRALLRRYFVDDPGRWGVPIDWMGMTRNGFVTGIPLPLSLAENLDDPRSPHCRANREGGWDDYAAYSARIRKFSGPEEYGAWIAADAKKVLETPISVQLDQSHESRLDRWTSKAARGIRRVLRPGWNRRL
jgi:glycosyltransferase involved in cell wall biosynthesis